MQSVTEQRLIEAFHTQLGPAVREALDCPTVVEVMVNDCGRVRLDTIDRGRIETVYRMSSESAEAIIRLVAHHIGETVGEDHPLIAGTIPLTGERFQGVLPPLTKAPTFTIRKRPKTIFRLEDYVTKGVMTARQADLLRQAVADHRNILVSGGTSSGKTTLLNALLAEPAITEDRVVLIEDTRELQCTATDQVQLLAKRTEPRITMRDLVQTTLRLRPDRIVVGEIRDGAGALEMLKAWNTGHDGGLGTLHANSASDALHRLEDLLSEVATNVPHRLIGTAIDLVVHIRRTPIGRRIDEILAVQCYDAGRYLTQDLTPEADPVQLLSKNQTERTPS
jgi:type IV secretion system protein VirB11